MLLPSKTGSKGELSVSIVGVCGGEVICIQAVIGEIFLLRLSKMTRRKTRSGRNGAVR